MRNLIVLISRVIKEIGGPKWPLIKNFRQREPAVYQRSMEGFFFPRGKWVIIFWSLLTELAGERIFLWPACFPLN